MNEEKSSKEIENLVGKDTIKFLKTNKKIIEGYQKNIKVVKPKYYKAMERVSKSIKRIDISDRIVNANSQTILNDKQVVDTLALSNSKTQIQAVIPAYQSMIVQAKNALGINKLSEMAEQQLNFCNENIIKSAKESMASVIRQIAEMQRQFMNSINKSIIPALRVLSDSINEAKNNPDSVFSWMNYYDKLSDFFWIMPYKMTTEELYEILQNITTEKEFDQYINRYFNKVKVESLCLDIRKMLSNNNQRKIFDQITTAYKNRLYALASIGITTMIDNSLSYYLIDKGCTSRMKLFEPIIKDLNLKRGNSDFLFIVMMVNSNINLLYEQIEFNNKISIKTNKKSRRNPISHGKSYSYKKIDTIMLMNTLYYLLIIQNELKEYRNTLYRNSNKKEFYIPTREKKRAIKEKIKSKK